MSSYITYWHSDATPGDHSASERSIALRQSSCQLRLEWWSPMPWRQRMRGGGMSSPLGGRPGACKGAVSGGATPDTALEERKTEFGRADYWKTFQPFWVRVPKR